MELFKEIIIPILTLLIGGGVVALFTLPEVKKAKQIENEDSLVARWQDSNDKFISQNKDLLDANSRLEEKEREDFDKIIELTKENVALRAIACYTRKCPERNPPLGSLNDNCDCCDGVCIKKSADAKG